MPESPTDLPRGYQQPTYRDNRDDPSALTVAMLERAIAQVREFYDAQLIAIKEGLEVAHEDYVRVPTLLDRSVGEIKELFETKIGATKELLEEKITCAAHVRQEQFHALDVQLEARAERARDLDAARESALNHALAAAKELVAAANNNFTKQIEGLQLSTGSQIKSLDEKVNDLRDRFTHISSTTQGAFDNRRDARDHTSLIIAGLALLAAIALHFIK
jgi:hypothetical protein